ncbi:hypothetical protein SCE1572_29620 [Sorangium cellulosum So0157-2]|uniref:Uncharacterized protein n=1 Tax=Sorangium cellulosum So0157-2 TaxID=1254432 RepID=S4Y5T0_SORCE|nr:hypothetical protein SCE1572_29620 [Sorangium cellulosum So0157-2]
MLAIVDPPSAAPVSPALAGSTVTMGSEPLIS